MKKSKLFFVVLLFSSFSAGAQFLYALGVAAGISYGKEGWKEEQWSTGEKYLLGFNGAVLAEFFRSDNFQWRSEIMYNQLGTGEAVASNNFVNRTNYISFNNYLKIKYPLFSITPYILIGPRVAYLLSRSASVFPDAIGGMDLFHVTGAVGIGVSKITYGHWTPFIELFYNRDIMPSFIGSVASNDPSPSLFKTSISEVINNHDFELRIGVKYVFDEKSECPPVDNPAGNPKEGEYIIK
jgi:hypothetical protein